MRSFKTIGLLVLTISLLAVSGFWLSNNDKAKTPQLVERGYFLISLSVIFGIELKAGISPARGKVIPVPLHVFIYIGVESLNRNTKCLLKSLPPQISSGK